MFVNTLNMYVVKIFEISGVNGLYIYLKRQDYKNSKIRQAETLRSGSPIGKPVLYLNSIITFKISYVSNMLAND